MKSYANTCIQLFLQYHSNCSLLRPKNSNAFPTRSLSCKTSANTINSFWMGIAVFRESLESFVTLSRPLYESPKCLFWTKVTPLSK